MKVYLAGPINGRTDDDCKNWRAHAEDFLGRDCTKNPMVRDYRGRENEPGICKVLVEADLQDIRECTALLVYFDQPSVGTSCEVVYAHGWGLPVFVVNVSGKPVSPWLTYHAKAVLPTLRDGLHAVRVWHEQASY